MKTDRLPITSGCGGCSRREMLQGLGAAAVGAVLVASCASNAGSNLAFAAGSSCGSGQCIDLTSTSNKDLTAAGGAMLLTMGSDTVMVIRSSDTAVIALSAICTHEGCSMDYNASQNRLDCPCHGSRFSMDGKVLTGPASRPVRVYTATLANNMITVS